MRWKSTELYYRSINKETEKALIGLHLTPIAMVSVDRHEIERLQDSGD